MNDVVFIVPSVIYFDPAPISYSIVRSIYSPEIRAEQTAMTISSVREKVPNAKVILMEMGLRRELPFDLHLKADQYVYLGHRRYIRKIADGPNKGHGEALALLLAHRAAMKYRARYYFKLGGRAWLDHRFSLDTWVNEPGFAALKYSDDCCASRLYGFPAEMYDFWRESMRKALPLLEFGSAMERVLPQVVSPIRHVNIIGLRLLLAPHGVGVVE